MDILRLLARAIDRRYASFLVVTIECCCHGNDENEEFRDCYYYEDEEEEGRGTRRSSFLFEMLEFGSQSRGEKIGTQRTSKGTRIQMRKPIR